MKSKYNFFGRPGLILLIWIFSIVFCICILIFEKDATNRLVFIVVTLLQQLLLYYFATKQLKKVVIDDKGITLANPIFSYNKSFLSWNEIDYSFTVGIQTRSFGVMEVVWIIKDEKLVGTISELNYSNYEELKNSLSTTDLGEKELNTIQQFLCVVGLKKIKFR